MEWLRLLRKAVDIEGSQAAVARKLNLSTTTISQVLSGTYPSDTSAIAARVMEVYGAESVSEEIIPEGYKKKANGDLVPISKIDEKTFVKDEFITETIKKAKHIHYMLESFKLSFIGDFEAFLDMALEKFNVDHGGKKGNVSLMSFDGKFRIVRAIDDQIGTDEKILAAVSLIKEAAESFSNDVSPEAKILIDSKVQADRQGNYNVQKLKELLTHNIKNAKWQEAMDCLRDSLQVIGSRTYYRYYERDENDNWRQICLDFSGV